MFWAKKFLEEILTYISENNFSDLHLTSGRKARIRNRIGDLEEIEKIWEKKYSYFWKKRRYTKKSF